MSANSREKWQKQFDEFHAANPQVARELCKIALQVKRKGAKGFGIRQIWERLRWISTFETTAAPYKLNNNHTPFYARLLMEKVPELKGFFETRDHDRDEVRL